MKRLIAIITIVLGFCIYVHSLPTTSTDNLIQKNTSCDVAFDFSNMGLNIINPNFISNPYTKSLSLRYNKIESFREHTFDSLPSLEKLDLSNNALRAETLFSFGSMYALKSLNLDYNCDSVSTISDNEVVITVRTTPPPTTSTASPYYRQTLRRSHSGVCSEDQYKKADGSCNNYSVLNLEYEYPNLTHLSMRKICIDSLASDWADHFPKLSHLDISENYFGKAVSSDVSDRIPTSVTSLTMRNSHLTTLSVSNMENLLNLDLNGNRFDALSNYYCFVNTLCLKNLINLESLHVADCSLKMIGADTFTDAKKLNYLDISGNQFDEIPDGVFKFLPALEHLNLSRTNSNVMPDLSNLKNLTSLYMDNMIDEWLISARLERISMLPKLEVLSLRSNGLGKISMSFLDKFPKLIELNLSHNFLTTLPSWQGQNNLRKLSLDYNNIEHLEDISLKEAESLELMNLTGNKFTEIKIKYLKHLPDNIILKI